MKRKRGKKKTISTSIEVEDVLAIIFQFMLIEELLPIRLTNKSFNSAFENPVSVKSLVLKKDLTSFIYLFAHFVYFKTKGIRTLECSLLCFLWLTEISKSPFPNISKLSILKNVEKNFNTSIWIPWRLSRNSSDNKYKKTTEIDLKKNYPKLKILCVIPDVVFRKDTYLHIEEYSGFVDSDILNFLSQNSSLKKFDIITKGHNLDKLGLRAPKYHKYSENSFYGVKNFTFDSGDRYFLNVIHKITQNFDRLKVKKIQLSNEWKIPKDYPNLEEIIVSGKPPPSSVPPFVTSNAGYTLCFLKNSNIKNYTFSYIYYREILNNKNRRVTIIVESSKVETIKFCSENTKFTFQIYIKVPHKGVFVKELFLEKNFKLMNFNELLSSGFLRNLQSLELSASEEVFIENLEKLEWLKCISGVKGIYNCNRLEEVHIPQGCMYWKSKNLIIQKCPTLKKLFMSGKFSSCEGIKISGCCSLEEIDMHCTSNNYGRYFDIPRNYTPINIPLNFENTNMKRILICENFFKGICRMTKILLWNVKKIVVTVKNELTLEALFENIYKFRSLYELSCNNVKFEKELNVSKGNESLKKLHLKISQIVNSPRISYEKLPVLFPSVVDLKLSNVSNLIKSNINLLNEESSFRMIQFIDIQIKRTFGRKAQKKKLLEPFILEYTKRVVSFSLTFDLDTGWKPRESFVKLFSGPSIENEGITLDLNERKKLLSLKIDHLVYLKNHSESELKDISFLCKTFKFESIKNSGKFNLLEIRHCKEYDVVNENFIRNILDQTKEIYILSFRGGYSIPTTGYVRNYEKNREYDQKLGRINDFQEYKKIQELFPKQILVFEK